MGTGETSGAMAGNRRARIDSVVSLNGGSAQADQGHRWASPALCRRVVLGPGPGKLPCAGLPLQTPTASEPQRKARLLRVLYPGRYRFIGHPAQKSRGAGQRGFPAPSFSAACAAENAGPSLPARETPINRRLPGARHAQSRSRHHVCGTVLWECSR
jgi:hypothetical protein